MFKSIAACLLAFFAFANAATTPCQYGLIQNAYQYPNFQSSTTPVPAYAGGPGTTPSGAGVTQFITNQVVSQINTPPSTSTIFPGHQNYVVATWDGYIQFPSAGNWIIYAKADDGERVYLNNNLIINFWSTGSVNFPFNNANTPFTAAAGTKYPFRYEWFQRFGNQGFVLYWRPSTNPATSPLQDLTSSDVIPASAFFQVPGACGVPTTPECSYQLGVNAVFYQQPAYTASSPYPGLTGGAATVSPTYGTAYLNTTLPSLSFPNQHFVGDASHNDYTLAIITGYLRAPQTGMYSFSAISDDGVRFYIGNTDTTLQLQLADWNFHSPRVVGPSSTFSMVIDNFYAFRVEYAQRTGGNALSVFWQSMDGGVAYQVIPTTSSFSNQCFAPPYDNCQSNPCMNGGSCTDEDSSFTCACTGGFSGPICDIRSALTCANTTPLPTITANTTTAAGMALSTGRVTTFDGTSYVMPTVVGTFYLVLSYDSSVILQATTGMCMNSMNTICFKSVAYRSPMGSMTQTLSGSTQSGSVNHTMTTSSGNPRTIYTDNSSGMRIYIDNVGSDHLDIRVLPSVSQSMGRLFGLLGSFDGNPANDIQTIYGTTTTLNYMVPSWHVTNAQDLTMNPSVTITPIRRPSGCVPA